MKKLIVAVLLVGASVGMNATAQAGELSTIDYLGEAISQQANAVKNELLRTTEKALKQTMAEIKLVFIPVVDGDDEVISMPVEQP